ncbi:caspase family protein [Nonomuraea turkmeniaca]|uniref:Caspase family protein n=1 Tax=Nonomuraea turkmeniaca TaxID=103838 RepID=A0A5S4F575_9ACTN|nr:caspase family protein [Nonomuraea turkmeniaca]TMR11263.1 caspase family protein [Nonomuraea turkmeniaca]
MTAVFTPGHAVVVGVGRDLDVTVKDAQGIAAILHDPERCAYPESQVAVLTGPRANRAAVLEALGDLARRAGPDSTAVIYFSGHGLRHNGAHFLLPYDYDTADLARLGISGAQLATALEGLRCGRLALILDCCHAGGMAFEDLGAVKAPMPPEARELMVAGKGRALIASSRESEYSLTSKPYSYFTRALVEAFSGVGNSAEDGYVRVADLAMHARQVVPKWTKGRQHPTLDYREADNFVLAYYAAGNARTKGPPMAFAHASDPETLPSPFGVRGVRSFLADALSDSELDDLCLDYYPRVYGEFSSGMSRPAKIRALVEHCANRDGLAELAQRVRTVNANAYDRHFVR